MALIPIKYHQSRTTPSEDDETFLKLAELDWLRVAQTRSEYYVNLRNEAYTYGTPPHDRTYFPQPWHDVLYDLKREADAMAGFVSNAIFLNMYANERDHLGWHADDSPEMDPNFPIVIMAFGAERDIMFRENQSPNKVCPACGGEGSYVTQQFTNATCATCMGGGRAKPLKVETLRMEHGSMLIMAAGMQQTHQHRIPKAGFQCGPRISLTFRRMK